MNEAPVTNPANSTNLVERPVSPANIKDLLNELNKLTRTVPNLSDELPEDHVKIQIDEAQVTNPANSTNLVERPVSPTNIESPVPAPSQNLPDNKSSIPNLVVKQDNNSSKSSEFGVINCLVYILCLPYYICCCLWNCLDNCYGGCSEKKALISFGVLLVVGFIILLIISVLSALGACCGNPVLAGIGDIVLLVIICGICAGCGRN
ncbi:10022_t:CDS:1 [Dentiscutata erythropus]|uniref:10022_t:CDS:1 n=1 Tax=Dentiscutata erythropus TaxID=1348616 RepID=A0A9N9BY56_9GLOM|nr:10022_t:CDS:1 [Dentiscutata erythropus]